MASEKDQTMESKTSNVGDKPAAQDEELQDLLDSALEDFDSQPKTTSAQAQPTEKNDPPKCDADPLGFVWSEEFMEEARSQFEQGFQSVLLAAAAEGGKTDEIGEKLQKIAQAAAKAVSEESAEGDFSATIAQTLKNLSEGATNLQSPMNEEELRKMFGTMGLGAEDNNFSPDGDFLPVLQTMMHSLLCKDILLPAMQNIVEQYPGWLEEQKSKLQDSEYQKYDQQYRLMCEVCEELNKEKESDSEEVKTIRFEKVLDLLQRMQGCGQPPKELVGDLNSVVQFDEQGNPKFSDIANQCSLM